MINTIYKHKVLIKYFFIGVSAAAIDVAIYAFLYNVGELSALVSTGVSVSFATVYAFTLNMFFNFKLKDKFLSRLAFYVIVSGVGLAISMSMLYIFTDVLNFNGNIVKIVSLPLIFVVQYILNKHFTFRVTHVADEPRSSTEADDIGEKSVAVIGGGFSGLAAAYELSKEGHKVTIFENSDHLGGLASSFDLNGYPVERAYHFLYQSDSDILGLSEELGIRERIVFHPSNIRYFHEGTDYGFMTPMDLLKFTPLSLIDRVRLGVMTLYLKKVKNWRPLSTVTAYDWLNTWMGENVTREVWEPLLKGKFDRYYDKITMSWLWGRFNIRARSQNKDLSGEKLGYPEGSFAIVVDAIVNFIKERSAVIKTSTAIASIRNTEGQVKIVTRSGEEFSFDGVVSTVPSGIFANLIEGDDSSDLEYLNKLRSIDYLDAVVMVFRTPQRLSNTFWYNIKDDRVPFLTMLSPSELAGTEQFGGSHVYFVGAYIPREHRYMQEGADIEGEWKEGLRVMFPDFDESKIQDLKISKFKDSQHIVDLGYEEKKLVPFKTPLEGVYLANFSQIYPDDRGTNFAIRDGRAAAKEMLISISTLR